MILEILNLPAGLHGSLSNLLTLKWLSNYYVRIAIENTYQHQIPKQCDYQSAQKEWKIITVLVIWLTILKVSKYSKKREREGVDLQVPLSSKLIVYFIQSLDNLPECWSVEWFLTPTFLY